MVNLQECLDREYPTQVEKEQVKEITVRKNENIRPYFYTSLSLTQEQVRETDGGELTLHGYLNLKKIWIVEGGDDEDCLKTKLTKLDIVNCPNLTWIECWVHQLTNLDLSKQVNLNWLSCCNNHLTNLDLRGCVNLTYLNCQLNQLTNLEFLNGLSGEKLETLWLSDNNFSSDLTPLSKFINLKKLWLGSRINQTRIEKGICNRFIGSLAPLQKMRKLEVLDISNTDIDSGLEYLPESIEYFWCSTEERPQAGCQVLQKQLAPYKAKPGSHYNYQAWKKANPDLIIARWKKEAEEDEEEIVSKKRKITELEEELQIEREEAAKALDKAKEWRERQLQEITTQKDKVIEQLKKQVSQLQVQLKNQEQTAQILHQPFGIPGSSKK